MSSPSTATEEVLVCRETVVINVGGKPAKWGTITVKDRRTGLEQTILDTDNAPLEPEDPGSPMPSRPASAFVVITRRSRRTPRPFVRSTRPTR
jgi:hypothetical protein